MTSILVTASVKLLLTFLFFRGGNRIIKVTNNSDVNESGFEVGMCNFKTCLFLFIPVTIYINMRTHVIMKMLKANNTFLQNLCELQARGLAEGKNFSLCFP